MHVELLAYTGGKGRVMAVIQGNGAIDEKEQVPEGIRDDIEKARKHAPNDEYFLRSLLMEFSGTYYRAKLIAD